MQLRFTLVFILISASLNCFGQYKNLGVGLKYSTNSYYLKDDKYNPSVFKSDDYFMFGTIFQYNTRKLFSFAVEPTFEKTVRYNFNNSSYAGGIEDWYNLDSTMTGNRFSTPVIAKFTFGNKWLLTPYAGFSYAVNLASSSLITVKYAIDDENKEHPYDRKEELANKGNLQEFNIVYGASLAYQIQNRFLLSIDSRFVAREFSYPKHENRGNYASYPRPTLAFSLIYQFNLKKESDYNFSNYYLKLQKTTNGN